MSAQMNVPKLRFPEFSGGWEEKKLKDIVKINQGLQIPISDRLAEQVKNSFFYITNEFLKEKSQKKYFILNPSQSVLCTKDDILMTRTGNTGMVVTDVEGAFHNNFFKVAYPDNINKGFLYNFLKLKRTQNQILKMAGTSTIPDLNHSDFYSILMAFPSKEEQQKIANFLTAIDTKIDQLTKKQTLLKQYKKGVMQKFFSQELRFKADDGSEFSDWEEKEIADLDIFISDGNYGEMYPRADEMKSFGVPFIRANNIKNLKLIWDDMKYINKELHDVLLSGHLKVDDILVTTRGDIGMIAYVTDEFDGANINAQICLLRCAKTLKPSYVMQYLASSNGLKQFKELQTGTALKQLPKKNLGKVKIAFPSLEEQTKIANLLTAIDTKIDLATQQLDATKQFKKALLQQMFV
jgi:type I restriction enzyme S subunit